MLSEVTFNAWQVRAETIIPQQVDHFADTSGKCGYLFSPTVRYIFLASIASRLREKLRRLRVCLFAAGVC
jgi:hypothetical protein